MVREDVNRCPLLVSRLPQASLRMGEGSGRRVDHGDGFRAERGRGCRGAIKYG